MGFCVGMRVTGTAGRRNNFKAWKERRGMVTVSGTGMRRAAGAESSVGNLRNPKVLTSSIPSFQSNHHVAIFQTSS